MFLQHAKKTRQALSDIVNINLLSHAGKIYTFCTKKDEKKTNGVQNKIE